MIVASWNVNSIRVRKDQVADWLETQAPDVLGLQELKCRDEDFPAQDFQERGYFCLAHGQSSYNGVALLTRRPVSDAVRGIPGLDDPQARAIAATAGDTRVINLYVPNGKEVGHDHYHYKLRWLAALAEWLRGEAPHPAVSRVGGGVPRLSNRHGAAKTRTPLRSRPRPRPTCLTG